jgi:5-methylthioribose kinase
MKAKTAKKHTHSSERPGTEMSRSSGRIKKLNGIKGQLNLMLNRTLVENIDLALDNMELRAQVKAMYKAIIEIGLVLEDPEFEAKLGKRIMLQDLLDYVRLMVKHTAFDLEATRRELLYVKKATGFNE